jgi:hypothetical protein
MKNITMPGIAHPATLLDLATTPQLTHNRLIYSVINESLLGRGGISEVITDLGAPVDAGRDRIRGPRGRLSPSSSTATSNADTAARLSQS